jgi:hypothetical protein
VAVLPGRRAVIATPSHSSATSISHGVGHRQVQKLLEQSQEQGIVRVAAREGGQQAARLAPLAPVEGKTEERGAGGVQREERRDLRRIFSRLPQERQRQDTDRQGQDKPFQEKRRNPVGFNHTLS